MTFPLLSRTTVNKQTVEWLPIYVWERCFLNY